MLAFETTNAFETRHITASVYMYVLFVLYPGLSGRERVWAVQSTDGGDWLVLL